MPEGRKQALPNDDRHNGTSASPQAAAVKPSVCADAVTGYTSRESKGIKLD